MRVSRRAPVVIVPARVYGPLGSRRQRLALDTGATFTMLHPAVLEDLGYDLAHPVGYVTFMTATKKEKAPVIVVDRVRALRCVRERVDVLAKALPRGSQVHGLLGLSFLRHFKLVFDLRRGVVRLHP